MTCDNYNPDGPLKYQGRRLDVQPQSTTLKYSYGSQTSGTDSDGEYEEYTYKYDYDGYSNFNFTFKNYINIYKFIVTLDTLDGSEPVSKTVEDYNPITLESGDVKVDITSLNGGHFKYISFNATAPRV